jgi:tRNA(fMet)-specific endonuclease VapC
VILDTNAVSALFVGDPVLGDVLAGGERHHLPVIVIGEYRYGLVQSRDRKLLRRLLSSLIRDSIVLPVDETTAETYSAVRDELRRKGKPIPDNDLWIAALARQHDQPVVSCDDHFDFVSGLYRIGW